MLTSAGPAGYRGDAERCRSPGLSAYLLKPIRQSELREAIARVLGAKEQHGAISWIPRFSLYDAQDATERPGNWMIFSRTIWRAEPSLLRQVLARAATTLDDLEQVDFPVVCCANLARRPVDDMATLCHDSENSSKLS
jgi:hypothetical protein